MILTHEVFAVKTSIQEHILQYKQLIDNYTAEISLLHSGIFKNKIASVNERIQAITEYIKILEAKLK